MAAPINDCFNAPSYEACVASQAAGYDRFSSWALPLSYSDVDSNPYVVGSQAWNLAHGLPAGPDWNERSIAAAAVRDATARDAAAAATLVRRTGANGLPLGGAESPSLLPLLAVGVLALLILRR